MPLRGIFHVADMLIITVQGTFSIQLTHLGKSLLLAQDAWRIEVTLVSSRGTQPGGDGGNQNPLNHHKALQNGERQREK